MSAPGRHSRRTRVLLVSGLAIGMALYVWFGPTFVREYRQIVLARRLAATVEVLLRREPDFADIRLGSGKPWLLVVGTVASAEDLDRLHSLVAACEPPVETVFRVRVK